MTTLRREAIQKVFNLLELAYQDNPWSQHAADYNKEQAEKIADEILAMRAFKPNMAKASMDWAVAGVEITQEEIDAENFTKKALDTFETDMGCPKNWTWYPAKTSEETAWRILREFVVEKYREDPNAFQRYQTWRTQPYSSGRMSNLAIKRSPEDFPASWSDFLASSAMYGSKQEAKVETDDNDIPMTY